MNTGIKLFSLISFKIEQATDKPVLFKHGDRVNFDTKIMICPSPSGLLELAKKAHADDVELTNFEIVSTISYVEKEKKLALKGFYSLVPEQKEGTIGLYEITNHFEMGTNALPENISQRGGYLALSVQWATQGNHRYTGDIADVPLPIYERS